MSGKTRISTGDLIERHRALNLIIDRAGEFADCVDKRMRCQFKNALAGRARNGDAEAQNYAAERNWPVARMLTVDA